MNRNKHEAAMTKLRNTQNQYDELKKSTAAKEKEMKKLQKNLEVGVTFHLFECQELLYYLISALL